LGARGLLQRDGEGRRAGRTGRIADDYCRLHGRRRRRRQPRRLRYDGISAAASLLGKLLDYSAACASKGGRRPGGSSAFLPSAVVARENWRLESTCTAREVATRKSDRGNLSGADFPSAVSGSFFYASDADADARTRKRIETGARARAGMGMGSRARTRVGTGT